MKKQVKVLSIAALALGLGFGISNIATTAAPASSIAVVDVAQVINNNAQVKALKAQQEKKSEALKTWVEADVEKQKTDAAKESLTQKYNKELQKKVEDQRKDLYEESTKIDAKISAAITKTAQAEGYSIVLVKGAVLYGGADITEAIKKATK